MKTEADQKLKPRRLKFMQRRQCLKCDRSFWSEGPWNRLCYRCNESNTGIRSERAAPPRWNGEPMLRRPEELRD